MTRVALVVLFAIIPLYGTLIALDPARPPVPLLVGPAVAAVFGVAALAALAAAVPAAVRAARRDAVTFAMLAPGIATIAAALTGFDPPLGIGLGLLVTGIGASALALTRTDAATARACIRAFLWSALLAALLALAMVVTRRPAAIYAYDHARAVGSFLNPNELAAYALVALGVAVPLAVVSRGRDRLATASAVVLIAALAATFSRWGALAGVCGVIFYAAVARSRRLLLAAVAVAALGLGLDALAGATHHNPRDAEARTVAWRTGLTTFQRFPLLGVGPLAFAHTYDELRPPIAPGTQTAVAFDPHSLPIAFAAEGGIVAVVTLALSSLILLRRVLREARPAPPAARAFALAAAASVVALLIDGAINTISVTFPLGFQVVALALAVVRTDALR